MARWRRTRPVADAPSGTKPASVVLLSRSGCHLCEQAEPVVARTAREAGVELLVRSVDEDPALRAQWTDHVPVVLIDGQEHSRWWVDEELLRRALHLAPTPTV